MKTACFCIVRFAFGLVCVLCVLADAPRSLAQSGMPTLTQVKGTPALGTAPTPSNFTFVVAGDNRPPSANGVSVIFEGLPAKLATTGASFIIWTGDTVYGKLKDPASEEKTIKKEYKYFESTIAQANLPVFNAPGNHEMNMKGNVPDPSGNMVRYYEDYVGPQYGYFTYGSSAFVALNTDDGLPAVNPPAKGDYAGNVSPDQLAALNTTLTALASDSSIAHIFVFMHRPVHATPGHPDNALGPPSGPLVQAVLENYNKFPNLSYVFAGHQHLFYANPPAAPYGPTFSRTDAASAAPLFLISGGAGACLAGSAKPSTGGFYNYLVVTVNGAQVNATLYNLGSKQDGC